MRKYRNLSHGPAETKNRNKNDDNEEVQGNSSHFLPEWLQEFRHGLFQNNEMLPVLLMNYLWSREQKWYRVNTTSFPTDRNCVICLRTKITRASFRRRTGTVVPRAENFGDLITADHKVLREGCESRHNHRYAVVAQDLATDWIQSHPCKTKTSQETEKSLQKVHGTREETKSHLR